MMIQNIPIQVVKSGELHLHSKLKPKNNGTFLKIAVCPLKLFPDLFLYYLESFHVQIVLEKYDATNQL